MPTVTSVFYPRRSHSLIELIAEFISIIFWVEKEKHTYASTETPAWWPKKGTYIKKWKNPAGLISCQTIYQPWPKQSGLRRSVEVGRQLVVYSTWNRAQIRELWSWEPWKQIFLFTGENVLPLSPDTTSQSDEFSACCSATANDRVSSDLVGGIVKNKSKKQLSQFLYVTEDKFFTPQLNLLPQ